jgi:hypothetical protein
MVEQVAVLEQGPTAFGGGIDDMGMKVSPEGDRSALVKKDLHAGEALRRSSETNSRTASTC